MSEENRNVLFEENNIALIDDGHQYIVAIGYNKEDKTWGQGHYFTHWNKTPRDKAIALDDAINYYLFRTENLIPKCRLIELATLFKDGLIEDDEENALEYFTEVCEMEDYEKEFFGIESEEY